MATIPILISIMRLESVYVLESSSEAPGVPMVQLSPRSLCPSMQPSWGRCLHRRLQVVFPPGGLHLSPGARHLRPTVFWGRTSLTRYSPSFSDQSSRVLKHLQAQGKLPYSPSHMLEVEGQYLCPVPWEGNGGSPLSPRNPCPTPLFTGGE